jgi:hypothetical protein
MKASESRGPTGTVAVYISLSAGVLACLSVISLIFGLLAGLLAMFVFGGVAVLVGAGAGITMLRRNDARGLLAALGILLGAAAIGFVVMAVGAIAAASS